MLDVFITSRVRRKIVVVYAKYPDFHTHVRGLAKLIKEDPDNITNGSWVPAAPTTTAVTDSNTFAAVMSSLVMGSTWSPSYSTRTYAVDIMWVSPNYF